MLRGEVESLLAYRSKAQDFIEEPALQREERPREVLLDSAVPAGEAETFRPPEVTPFSIGPYRLLQRIGEGGMAEVWLAEQTTPLHRRVAVKLIKAGMDSKAMIARFESERQALALMEHPAIAKVFDAGARTGPFYNPRCIARAWRGEPESASSRRSRARPA